VIRTVMVAQPAVEEYQVRQTTDGIAVAVVLRADTDLEGVRADLVERLAAAGLDQPAVCIEAQSSLRSPDTGKIRTFVPLPA
jgi:hypothetical protein